MDLHELKVGDVIIHTRDGRSTEMTIYRIGEPGESGTSRQDGPRIFAHTRPGGFGMSFDRRTIEAGYVTITKKEAPNVEE